MKRYNELLVYDPEFVDKGHYTRFNKYILKMLVNLVHIKKIIYFGNKLINHKKIYYKKIKNLNTYSVRHFILVKKINFFLFYTINCIKNIYYMNKFGENKRLLLLGESNFIFGLLFLFFYRYNYSLVVISTKPIFEKNFFSMIKFNVYKMLLNKADFIIVLNKINQNILKKLFKNEIYYLPERYL